MLFSDVFSSSIHRFCPALRVLHHLQSLLLQEFFLLSFRDERHAVGPGMMVFIEIREGSEAISSDLFRLTAAVHSCINGEGAAPCSNHLALVCDDIASENRELEIDAVEYEQDSILRVNILRHSEIGTF